MGTNTAPTDAECEAEWRCIATAIDPTGHLEREGERMMGAIQEMDENLELELVRVEGAVDVCASENQMLVSLDASIAETTRWLDPAREWAKRHDMVLVEKATVPALGMVSLQMTIYWYKSRRLIDEAAA